MYNGIFKYVSIESSISFYGEIGDEHIGRNQPYIRVFIAYKYSIETLILWVPLCIEIITEVVNDFKAPQVAIIEFLVEAVCLNFWNRSFNIV